MVCFGNIFTNFTPWQGPQKPYSVLIGGTLTSPVCPLNSFLFYNLLLEHSQKLYCVPSPVLVEDEYLIKYS